MHSQTILAPLTILLLVVTAVSVYRQMEENKANTFSRQQEFLAGAETEADPLTRQLIVGTSATTTPLLLAGMSSVVPTVEDYPALAEVPWDLNQVTTMYRHAGQALSCELLGAGVPLTQGLVSPQAGVAGALGRDSAFSIRLQLDPIGEAELPRVTRGAVNSYLESHQLTVQPTLYHTESGHDFFGPQVKAAFMSTDGSENTVEAEAMILSAISSLRTLGLVWESKEPLSLESARTMVLAFRYTTEERTAASPDGTSHREFELLFLHRLKDSTAENPHYAVFATSVARTQFHLLDTSDPTAEGSAPTVSATIRFGNMSAMGMYPALPVVTGVTHRALLTLPVDTVKAQLGGLTGDQSVSFSEFLDQLHERASTELDSESN
ncbi:MAG: hypothetical protein R3C19_17995 [Planctomycetaceae bacterium]